MIIAEQFSQAYEQVTQDQKQELQRCWPKPPLYTGYVKQQLMPAIANIFGCSMEAEYKRYDYVLRPLPDSQNHADGRTEIAAAVEHENNFGGAHSEIIKLRALNVPLGVLITFIGIPRRQEQLAEYARLLGSRSEIPDAEPPGEILVIVGPYGMTPPKVLTWEYFVFRGSGFQRLVVL